MLRGTLLSLFLCFFAFPHKGCCQEGDASGFLRLQLEGVKTGRDSNALTNMRTHVWNAWKLWNKQLPVDISRQPLTSAIKAQISLPDSLEPDAVMHYYSGTKGEMPKEGYPFFIYLHGSGPKAQEWSAGLALAKHFADAPSSYFIPQIPNEGSWYRWYHRSKQWAFERLLRTALLSDWINPQRIYLLGISEGGYGSQRLASFYADYWAAAGPMAGGEPLEHAPVENLRHVGFSLLTGADDKMFCRNILTENTAAALDSLSKLYPDEYVHRVQLLPGYGHAIDYSLTTPWLSKHTRRAVPNTYTWEDYEMDGRHRSGFYNLKVLSRPSHDTLRTRYDVCVKENRIDVTVSDVHYTITQKDPIWGIPLSFAKRYTPATGGSLQLFLDENLVNLNKKVAVYVNGKRVFHGKVKPAISAMQQSVATFFDPLRIFPVSVQLDY